MLAFLNNIRCVDKKIPVYRQIADTVGILLLGVALGVISKYLDCTASNELPHIIEALDFGNFLGRFAIWIFLAVCISVYSVSPVRAGINVFVFFAGMVASYYLYSKYVAGFFPKSYAMIWIGFTMISPLLAFICWYAKGKSKVSLVLSAGIIACLFNMTFVYGWSYFDIRSVLELVVFVCGLAVMKRKTFKETIIMTAVAIVLALALALDMVVPFEFG